MFPISTIHVTDDVPTYITQYLKVSVLDAIAKRGKASIVLAGGSTYRETYHKLSNTQLPWQSLEIFFGDERQVPLDHAYSNYRMAAEIFAEVWNPDLVHIPTDFTSYELSVERYLREYKHFDICLLGLGLDGHVASLFPGNTIPEGLVARVQAGQEPLVPRFTLTPQAMNTSRLVIITATGSAKAHIVSQIIDDQDTFPVSWIIPDGKKLLVLDSAAASGLHM